MWRRVSAGIYRLDGMLLLALDVARTLDAGLERRPHDVVDEGSAMKTCLVVDDSRVVRKVARRILEELSFAVEEAADGQLALEACLQRDARCGAARLEHAA